jgi:RNA polymerase-binding transcription factor DksA
MARSRPTPVHALNMDPTGRQGHLLDLRLPALRAALEQQRRFRREQLAHLNASGRGTNSSTRADLPEGQDREAALALREVDALVAAGARRALVDIELALVRIHTGRYGHCRSCAGRIPVAVLEAIPKTTLCLACQWRGERGDQRTPAPPRTSAARPRNRAAGSGTPPHRARSR